MIILSILAVLSVIAWFVSGKSKIGSQLMISAQEAYQLRAIGEAKGKADALMSDVNADQSQVEALQREITKRKAALTKTYESSEMSTDDIVARFQNLHL